MEKFRTQHGHFEIDEDGRIAVVRHVNDLPTFSEDVAELIGRHMQAGTAGAPLTNEAAAAHLVAAAGAEAAKAR